MSTLVIISHVATKMINEGILPKLIHRKVDFIILTDHSQAHMDEISRLFPQWNLSCVIDCDVFNPISIINVLIAKQIRPSAIFSNSDHLQTATSIAADFFDVSAKDWKAAQYCKNKSLMRQKLLDLNLSNIWQYTLDSLGDLEDVITKLQYPLIAKPCMGVASIGVQKINHQTELMQYCKNYFHRDQLQPALLLEKCVCGDIYSIETLGDNKQILVIGGFKTSISAPPYFIETHAKWLNGFESHIESQLLNIFKALKVQFGACHTEFIIDEITQKIEIIEINYRSVGDHKEFLINDLFNDQYFDSLLDIYLGQSLSNHLSPRDQYAHIHYFVADENGVILQSPRDIAEPKLKFTALKHAKDQIKRSYSNKDYLGILYAFAESNEALRQALNTAKNSLHWELDKHAVSLREWRIARQYIIKRLLDSFIREQLGAFRQAKMSAKNDFLVLVIKQANYYFPIAKAQFLQTHQVTCHHWYYGDGKARNSNIIALMRALFDQFKTNDQIDLAFAIAEYKTAVLHHALKLKLEPQKENYFSDSLSFYDHLASFSDHPLYPTARAKLGFPIRALVSYAPEYAQCFKLRWLGIERSHVHLSDMKPHFWPTAATFELNVEMDKTHVFIPIHPFAYELVLGTLKQQEIDYIETHKAYLEVRATLSVRTLSLVDYPHIHLKLPLNIRTLSTKNIRLIKPSTINDGAVIQKLLSRILTHDQKLSQSLQLCDESFGGHVGNLSALGFIVRIYPQALFAQRYLLVPVAALAAKNQMTLVIEQLCNDYYAGNMMGFLKCYIATQLSVHLRLAFEYGIALEANQQNSIIVIDKLTGNMQLLLKDNDAPRINKAVLIKRFPEALHHLNQLEDSRIISDDEEAAINMFVTIIWQLNIACILEVLINEGKLERDAAYKCLLSTLDEVVMAIKIPDLQQQKLNSILINAPYTQIKHLYTAGTFLPKNLTLQGDINKFYGDAPNFMSILTSPQLENM